MNDDLSAKKVLLFPKIFVF